MLLTTADGWERKAFWELPKFSEDIRYNGTPFRLNDIMSRCRFEEILTVHCTHDIPFPPYKDCSHPIRQFVNAWNDNIKEVFSPS